MRRAFKIEKLPLETLINLLIELYEKGIDYVDMFSDNTDPEQDKLIIQTKDSYINAQFIKDGFRPDEEEEDDEDEDDDTPPRKTPTIETKRLTEDDLNDLLQ